MFPERIEPSTHFQKIGLKAIEVADTAIWSVCPGLAGLSLALSKLDCEKSIKPVCSPPSRDILRS